MADGTHIEWTDATWNPITGCMVVSPGCTNCYAMRLAGTRLKHHRSRAGLTRDTKAGPVWTGEVRFNEQWLDQPPRWKTPRRIFVCAHGDLFAENVPDEWIDRVFAVMELCPQHTFQLLSKRSARMREHLTEQRPLPLPNCWLGVSVEDQVRADERIPDLLATPAAVRFISCEPMLGPIRIPAGRCRECGAINILDGLRCEGCGRHTLADRIRWVICGGESGPGARPMNPDWARSLRDQCTSAGVPYFFKQWGEYRLNTDHEPGEFAGCIKALTSVGGADYCRVGKSAAGRLLDGREWAEFPRNPVDEPSQKPVM